MANDKIDLRSLTFEEMEKLLVNIEEKKFRGKQIFNWINKHLINTFDEMNNIPKSLKAKLDEIAYISTVEILEKKQSKIDETAKFLFNLNNNAVVEAVFMKYKHGNTVCISSQAGCRMGCTFCASTIGGVDRNLTAGEMALQVYEIQKNIGERISNIVIMGSGEPFDNFENLIGFINIINSKEGLEIGQRHITVSTCGLVPMIYEFTQLKLQVNLAISLHAPTDELRQTMMPIAKKYDIKELIKACKFYSDTTKRRITYEYALIKGVNDSHKYANELGRLLRHTLCHVNLIPINNVDEYNYIKSDKNTIVEFGEILKSLGVEATIRRELGADINAACGQLRKKHINN